MYKQEFFIEKMYLHISKYVEVIEVRNMIRLIKCCFNANSGHSMLSLQFTQKDTNFVKIFNQNTGSDWSETTCIFNRINNLQN